MKMCSTLQFSKKCFFVAFLFAFLLLQVSKAINSNEEYCVAGTPECSMGQREKNKYEERNAQRDMKAPQSTAEAEKEEVGDDESLSSQLIHRSMQGLEGMFDKVANSKAQMMKGLDTVMDKMSESKDKMMEGLDTVMDKVSESRDKMMESLDTVMDKVSKSKEKVMEKVREGIDKVAHSKMMEELDHVIESVAHSKVLEEIRALPREIRESFILSTRNQSYLISGILVAIAAAILFCGAIYYAWCHHDAWSYHIGSIEEAKALLKKAKESAEKCVSSAAIASNGDFASELCNMTTRGCQAEGAESSRCQKESPKKESEPVPDQGSGKVSADVTPSSSVPSDLNLTDGHPIPDVGSSGDEESSEQLSLNNSQLDETLKVAHLEKDKES